MKKRLLIIAQLSKHHKPRVGEIVSAFKEFVNDDGVDCFYIRYMGLDVIIKKEWCIVLSDIKVFDLLLNKN